MGLGLGMGLGFGLGLGLGFGLGSGLPPNAAARGARARGGPLLAEPRGKVGAVARRLGIQARRAGGLLGGAAAAAVAARRRTAVAAVGRRVGAVGVVGVQQRLVLVRLHVQRAVALLRLVRVRVRG